MSEHLESKTRSKVLLSLDHLDCYRPLTVPLCEGLIRIEADKHDCNVALPFDMHAPVICLWWPWVACQLNYAAHNRMCQGLGHCPPLQVKRLRQAHLQSALLAHLHF